LTTGSEVGLGRAGLRAARLCATITVLTALPARLRRRPGRRRGGGTIGAVGAATGLALEGAVGVALVAVMAGLRRAGHRQRGLGLVGLALLAALLGFARRELTGRRRLRRRRR